MLHSPYTDFSCLTDAAKDSDLEVKHKTSHLGGSKGRLGLHAVASVSWKAKSGIRELWAAFPAAQPTGRTTERNMYFAACKRQLKGTQLLRFRRFWFWPGPEPWLVPPPALNFD